MIWGFNYKPVLDSVVLNMKDQVCRWGALHRDAKGLDVARSPFNQLWLLHWLHSFWLRPLAASDMDEI